MKNKFRQSVGFKKYYQVSYAEVFFMELVLDFDYGCC